VARLHAGIPAPEGGSTPAAGATSGPGEAGGHLESLLIDLFGPDAPLTKALWAPGGSLADHELWNTRRLRAAEVPAANGVGDARSIARMYSACVGEVVTPTGERVRILSPDQVERATVQQTEGPDLVILDVDLQFGLGFLLNRGVTAAMPIGGPRSFGHFGMGGSVGWADPDTELGMGYVTNKMELGLTGDTRSYRLAKACNEAIAAL